MALTAFGGVSEGITEGLKNTEQLQNIAFNKQKAAIGEIQLKEAQRQQEMDNTVIPLSSLQKGFELFPSYSGGLLQMGKDMGIVKDIGGQQGVLAGDFKRLNKILGDVEAYKDKSLEWVSSDLTNLRKNIEGKIAEAKSDKDKEPLQNQLKVVMQQQEKNTNEMYKRQVGMKKIADENTPESFAKFYNGGTVADLVPIEMAKERIKAEKRTAALQDKGILKDGRTVSFDPETGRKFVEGGEPYDQSKHGTIKTNALSQNTIYNVTNQQKDEFAGWSQEAKEEKFRQEIFTGKAPEFGSGPSGSSSKKQYNNESAEWRVAKGITPAKAYQIKSKAKALDSALTKNENRSAQMGGYVNQIEEYSNYVEQLKRRLGTDYGRIGNKVINSLKGFVGDGDLASFRLAMNSVSNLIGKADSGNLSAVGLSVDQSKVMRQLHDGDISLEDLRKLLKTGKVLGEREMRALENVSVKIQKQQEGLLDNVAKGKEEPSANNTAPQKTRVRMPRAKIEEYKKFANKAVKEAVSKARTDEDAKKALKDVEAEYKRVTGEDY